MFFPTHPWYQLQTLCFAPTHHASAASAAPAAPAACAASESSAAPISAFTAAPISDGVVMNSDDDEAVDVFSTLRGLS